MADRQPDTPSNVCVQAGFRFGNSGAHISRTLMLNEISRCLDLVPIGAARCEYQAAIVERNILGKGTEATRRESFRRLRELYALEPSVAVFRIYRELDALDAAARPLLSLLVACARDPLLRATIPVVLGCREGTVLAARHFDEALERGFPGHLKPKIRAATARHVASTWQQSGHLLGKSVKTRARVAATPAALTMALILGSLQDGQGAALFATAWCQILDLNAAQAQTLAAQAHREGLLDLRAAGSIVEVTFSRFAGALDAGGAHGPL